MLKTCIKHPLSYIAAVLLLLSGCAAITGAPQPEVSPQLKQAYQAALASMQAGKHELAIKQFNTIIKTNAKLAGPHTNLGIIYLKQNALQQAEQSLQKAIELNPKNKIAYNYLGIMYRQQGRFDDAEKAYLNATKIDKTYSYAHLNLGILYDLYKADLTKALSHYQTYQELTDKQDKMVEKWIVDIQRRNTASRQAGEIKG